MSRVDTGIVRLDRPLIGSVSRSGSVRSAWITPGVMPCGRFTSSPGKGARLK